MGRIFKIALVLFLALLLVLGSLLFFYVETESFDRWVRTQIINQLEKRFAVNVELGDVDARLFETEVELKNLKIWDLTYPSSQPAINIDRIFLDYSALSYLSPKFSLDHLELSQPRIRIIEDPNGRLNLSNMFFRPGLEKKREFSLFRLGFKRITIDEGLIVYRDQPIFLESSEGAMSLEMKFFPNQQKYSGKVDLSRFDLSMDGFGVTQLASFMNFEYLPNQLRFFPVTFNSVEFDGEAMGAITDLSRFVYRFETDLSVNLPKLKKPNFAPYVQKGLMHFSGTVTGRRGDITFRGRGSSTFVRFEGLSFQNVDTRLVVRRDFAHVESFEARFYEGSVKARGRLALRKELQSQFQITSKDVSIYPLLAEFGQRQIRTFGRGDFQETVSWPGLKWDHMTGSGQLAYRGDFVPPATPSGWIPFQGSSNVVFQPQELRLESGMVRTPHTLINYEGLITFKGGYDLNVQLASNQGSELPQLSQSVGIVSEDFFRKYPVELRGPSRAAGKLAGFRSRFTFTGSVQSERVFQGKDLLGDFRSEVAVANDLLQLRNARLTGTDYSIQSATFRMPLGAGRALMAVKAELDRAPLEKFIPILGYQVPVQGRASGQIAMQEFAPNRFRGSGHALISQPQAYGEALSRITARIDFEGSQLSLRDLHGSLNGGTILGQVAANLETKIYSVDLQGRQLPLERIHALVQHVPIRGRVNVSITGTGNRQNPDFHILATAREVFIREHALGNVALDAAAKGENTDFQLRTSLRGNDFVSTGRVGLNDPYHLNAKVDFQNTPVAPYIGLLPFKNVPHISGRINGRVTVAGPLKDRTQLTGRGTFPQLNLSMRGYEVRNRQPLQLSYQAGALTIVPVTLTGTGTELNLGGTLKLEKPRSIDVKVAGAANLVLLNSFLPAGSSGGQVQLATTIYGSLQRPQMVGTAQLTRGFFSHPDLPTTIADAQGTFKFTANQVSIDNFTARTVQGRLNAEGGIFLEGFRPARWRVNVVGSGLRVEYPTNVVSLVNVDVDLLKSESSQLISGVVYVRAAEYTQELTLAELILRQTSAEVISPRVHAQDIRLNIDVEAHRSLRIKNNLADIVASGDFILRGTIQNPVILGRVIIDEGKLFFENNDYEITRGTIAFNDPRRTTPVLDFEAQTDVRDFTVSVLVRGPFDRLNTAFRSEPPLSTASIVSLLAVGQTQEEVFGRGATTSQPQLGTLAFYGATALLSKSVGERLESRTSRLFGFDRFSIDPFLLPEDPNPSARITLGKKLTKNLVVTYSTVLGSETQAQIVVLEYALTNWLTAVGTREEDGSIGIDFKLKKRF